MPKYRDIPQITRGASYAVDISWHYLPSYYLNKVTDWGLDVNPIFQRGHVWTVDQKAKYIEYVLMGGKSGKDIYTNCPSWHSGRVGAEYPEAWYVLVDGKQRLDAVLGYINNEFPIFGDNYHRDYTDGFDTITHSFRWHVNELPTMQEVYRWYIDLNTGGTQHAPEEIARVQALLDADVKYVRPSPEEIAAQARLDREVLVAVAEKEAQEEREKQEQRAAHEAAEAAKPKRKTRRK